ncbi:hypothetical protein HPB47_023966 [Ixodes persulcatus]|uniref:Uncharacterized protein n=1 Tax=Ixodes persulcatus TaxID=34615 RepID=A0AC60Q5K2_IXOPE|nr:hypothetical protein HPB47_023966 [Ixodes persulcatus]
MEKMQGIQTTYLRKRYVMENLSYTDVLVMPLQTGNQALQESVCYVPLSPLLGNLLSSTEILESVMQPIHQSKVLQDITDGDFLSQQLLRQEDSETPTIFLLLNSDELELSNPLGAAAGSHKILVVYFSVINIHPRHRSKLRAVHLLLLVRYPMVNKYGLDRVLAPLIQDLNYVHEHGVHAQGKHFNVVTVAFTGDNLSMHKMAGLQCCFSSGRICRFCLGRYGHLQKLFSEADSPSIIRTGAHRCTEVRPVVFDQVHRCAPDALDRRGAPSRCNVHRENRRCARVQSHEALRPGAGIKEMAGIADAQSVEVATLRKRTRLASALDEFLTFSESETMSFLSSPRLPAIAVVAKSARKV